ncbi:hypothetical protein AVEN_274685-1 [Araneus ventricosus]|uniref:Uncharacterized protein n=1 Tax=Araneus ventricosus TaxID=182803 RepID=A0A4Y2VK48_ARAVE|nr:hypothetical protein AVEN_274685-1 [Araneus ventricosus]
MSVRPPRQKRGHCGRTHYSPHYDQFMRRPSHYRSTIHDGDGLYEPYRYYHASKGARPHLLIREHLIHVLVVPPGGRGYPV